MFTSIKEFHTAIFGFFGKVLTIEHNNGTLEIPCVYARHSNSSYYAKMQENYPRIVTLDKQIRPSNDWRPNEEKYVCGYEKSSPELENYDMAILGKDPVELLIDFQITGYFKNLDQKLSFISWVFGTFRAHGGLLLQREVVDGTIIGSTDVGVMVTYTLQTNEAERSDGVFEYNLMFTFKPLIYLDPVEILPVIQEFNINNNSNN